MHIHEWAAGWQLQPPLKLIGVSAYSLQPPYLELAVYMSSFYTVSSKVSGASTNLVFFSRTINSLASGNVEPWVKQDCHGSLVTGNLEVSLPV